MPAPFSRLQLAAALIEYDNDPDDVDGNNRSAQESAIFAHFRRNPAARPDLHSRHSTQSNHLGVELQTDYATQDGRDSALGRRSRNSRGSIDALRNPFGTDSMYDEEPEEEEAREPDLEVDLSSWGLDQFIPKEKTKSKGKQRQSLAPTLSVVRSRTISGGPNEFGGIPAAMAQSKSLTALSSKRQSTSSRLDFTEDSTTQYTNQRRRAASQSTFLPSGVEEGDGGVPFPSGRRSSTYDQMGSPREPGYVPRAQSRASIGSRPLLDEAREEEGGERTRTFSQGTSGTPDQTEGNPFALQPPSHTSRFDPKAPPPPAPAHARTISHGSLGSRGLLDNFDAGSVKSNDSAGRNRPYSVVELLRPKVLVMPSPLQQVGHAPATDNKARDGFAMSTDGPPLPPGARPMSRRMSTNLDSVPIPSNSFIPNPTADLTYAQKVFRNTLAVPGVSAYDAEGALPRATEDGEQIQFEAPIVPQVEEEQVFGHGQPKPGRPTGKLYGKSLIDDLEARKQAMRSKQRVFTGDQRPSMMARDSNNRASTLIDPATLTDRPKSAYDTLGSQNALGRRNSFKPLLNFEDDSKVQLAPPAERVSKNKSVFGVDTLWEQEMVKLRAIQEQERVDQEARRLVEEEEARKKAEKDKIRKGRRKLRKGGAGKVERDSPEPMAEDEVRTPIEEDASAPEPRTKSIELPVLPAIKPTIRRTVPAAADDDSSDEDSDEDVPTAAPAQAEATGAWHSDSEDEGPRRTTGVGLRNPSMVKRVQRPQNSDSEEDVPLTVAKQRVATRNTRQISNLGDSDDEDKPLAQVLLQPKKTSTMLDINFNRSGDSDDEDSQPLGLRASRAMLNTRAAGEDDDQPLAFHPEQQRRTQYQLFAAAQQQQQVQQQQAMMMQAQFQSSMFFNQPMVAPPYFAPPMMNPMAMMQPPMPAPSPPPIHDEAKFMSVDRWRRDVTIDGPP